MILLKQLAQTQSFSWNFLILPESSPHLVRLPGFSGKPPSL